MEEILAKTEETNIFLRNKNIKEGVLRSMDV